MDAGLAGKKKKMLSLHLRSPQEYGGRAQTEQNL